jgi:hypothetical protein
MNKLSDIEIKSPITLLIDGSGEGIIKDIPVYVVDETMCKLQGGYYCKEVYPKKRQLAKYVYDDLKMFYPSHDAESFDNLITKDGNTEFAHILGLITVAHGVLAVCKKENKSVKMYFENPECHMHPNRQSVLADWFLFLHTKYNLNG